MTEKFEQIVELIKEVLSKPDTEITEETRFFEELEFGSILTIQLRFCILYLGIKPSV